MESVIKYRKDIDGLRAIAVLSVVLFHLDVGLISGGFVGVDVFFVISGFLITSILYRDIGSGNFSFGQFFERRIRRLLPALFTMLAASTVIAWFVFLPVDFRAFSEGLAAAVIFLANIHYWDKTDYFGDPVEMIPLLHTWSLAVEEQFYIFFPLLLLFLTKYLARHVRIILAILAVMSLFSAQYMLTNSPEAVFYLMHLRAWEMLAGSLLALGAIPAIRNRWLAEWTAASGLLLIIASAFLLTKETLFPGVAAVPAVAGAAMVIHAGSSTVTWASRLLSFRVLVFVGLISYSLYLWHWPLFVFVRYYLIEPLQVWHQILLSIGACILGWLSWKFIETPFRGSERRFMQPRKRLFQLTACLSLLAIVVSLPGMITRGAAFRLPDQVANISAVTKETIPFRRPCFGLTPSEIDKDDAVCFLGTTADPSFLLWGDSHALSLAHGMDLAARSAGVSGGFLGKSVCPPVLDTQNFKPSDVDCSDFNSAAVRYLERHPSITRVILVGVWSAYDALSTEGYDRSFAAGLERTMDLMRDMEIDVTFINEVPKIRYDVPSVLARVEYFNRPLDIRTRKHSHLQRKEAFDSYLEDLSGKYVFNVVDLDSVYCDDAFCNVITDGRVLYRDSHHLSAWGSEQAKNELMMMISDLSLGGRHAAVK